MKELAKERDDGTYALLGMMHQCSSYLNINIHSKCVLYLIDTYLHNIGYCTFFEWLRSKEVNDLIENYKNDKNNTDWIL